MNDRAAHLILDPRLMPHPGDVEAAARGRERWREDAEGAGAELGAFMRAVADDAAAGALLDAVFGNSPYLSQSLIAEPEVLRRFLAEGPDAAIAGLLDALRREIAAQPDMATAMRALRLAKRRAALLIALADIAGKWPLESVCAALSALADTALSLACRYLLAHAAAAGDIALPHPDAPELDCGLAVIGMGKLGAGELNYSSDVDLMVFYEDEKIAYRGRRSVQEFCVALVRDLVRMIEERTGDGYVFRVDLRLRPDPGATPVAVSLLAAETYYEGFGQNWERAALIKARPVAGDLAVGEAFLRAIRPFIWRKNLDFAAIQDIHSIKRQIDAHKGGGRIAVAGHDIKLGRGGIREIEFFAQTQQLIRGGRDPALRTSRTIEALAALSAAGHMTAAAAMELSQAYRFLRMVEHRLQMIDDRQTQRLPSDPARLAALARFAGFDGLPAFDAAVRRALEMVELHYARLFEDAPPLAPRGNLAFTGTEDDPETLKTIGAMGFGDASFVCGRIRAWHHGRVRATRSTRARETLTEITPSLLEALARTADPDAAFRRFDTLLSGLPAGVPLFALLYSNPFLLDLVAEIMGDAPRLAESLNRHTALLDAVLSGWFYDPLPGTTTLARELGRQLARSDDFEEMMDVARRWANEQRFRVGVRTLRNLVDPEAAARELTDIAEAAIRCLVPRVEAEFARQHGGCRGRGAVLLALGKMGSREMTANSDLDLILVYDDVGEASDGPRPLAPSTYYGRLTQRIIAALTARTAEGVLYEADMRLRPSGNAGPIATSIAAFRVYHRRDAWTWEHMALTRARPIVGSAAMRAAVRRVIRQTLAKHRDPARLLADVAAMRRRMEAEHREASPWDVKHRRGGLVDIEFIAQYLQLRWAHDHPSILKGATAPAIGEARRLGLLAAADAEALLGALRLWTAIQQVLRQTVEGEFDEAQAPGRLRDVLARAARCADFAAMKELMEKRALEVQRAYAKLIDQPAEETAP